MTSHMSNGTDNMSIVNTGMTRYIQPSIRQNKPCRQRTRHTQICTSNCTEHVVVFVTVLIIALVALKTRP